MVGMTGTVLRLAACWTVRGLNSGGRGKGVRDFTYPSTPALGPTQPLIKLYNINITFFNIHGSVHRSMTQ
jgi:hypothetical protein